MDLKTSPTNFHHHLRHALDPSKLPILSKISPQAPRQLRNTPSYSTFDQNPNHRDHPREGFDLDLQSRLNNSLNQLLVLEACSYVKMPPQGLSLTRGKQQEGRLKVELFP